MLPMVVAQSPFRRHCDTLCTSGFVDYIMFFFYSGSHSGMNFATKDQFRLNLFTAKSERIQFPIIKGHNFGELFLKLPASWNKRGTENFAN